MNNDSPVFSAISAQIKQDDIVLYMKGNKQFPQCGFSGALVSILNNLKVKFITVNVLENQEIREGIKQFSNWPTIPQLYIKGEFIGGCDIVKEMYKDGELQELLNKKNLVTI